jgi:hypothetical protein
MDPPPFWRRRQRVRKARVRSFTAKLRYWQARAQKLAAAEGSALQLKHAKEEAERYRRLVEITEPLLRRAERGLLRAQKQTADRPRIVTAADIGLKFDNKFGGLGPEHYVTGHHTAGPVDKNAPDAIAWAQVYHRAHAAKGWGGIGYHFMLARDGTLICLRPVTLKGAHVGGHNTSNVGVVCNGTVGDLPTEAQQRTFRWLLENAHTLPKPHRTDLVLRRATRKGHNDWPGHESNACPGTHKRLYISGGESR